MILNKLKMPSKAEYNKTYYVKNREQILDYLKQRIICDRCDGNLSRACLCQHLQTEKCKLKYELKILKMKNT